MTTSVSFPNRLITSAQLRLLNQRSDIKGTIQLVSHLAMIAVAAKSVVYCSQSMWLLPAVLALAIAQIALFAPMHECSHQTAFRSLWLNKAVCWATGLVLMLPPTWFNQFHTFHHRYTQNPEYDPELAIPKPQNLSQYLWLISGIPYWRSAVQGLLTQAAGRLDGMDYCYEYTHQQVVREARIFLGVYATIAITALVTGSPAPLIYWLIPVLLGQPFLRLFLLPEHTGCEQSNNRLANTRTILASAPVRWLCWNMCYHAEHHLYPGVPFHALPALHQEVHAQLQVVVDSYPAAHRDICQVALNR